MGTFCHCQERCEATCLQGLFPEDLDLQSSLSIFCHCRVAVVDHLSIAVRPSLAGEVFFEC